MPNYYSWEDSGLRVNIRDQNKWKTIFHNSTYYYIGDIVRLVISIERLSPTAPSFSNIRIAEKLPSSKEYMVRKIGPTSASFTKIIFAIRGDVLDESGDDVWRLELHQGGSIKYSRKIFDAGIVNRDAKRRDINLAIIAAVFTLIGALLVLFIQYMMHLY